MFYSPEITLILGTGFLGYICMSCFRFYFKAFALLAIVGLTAPQYGHAGPTLHSKRKTTRTANSLANIEQKIAEPKLSSAQIDQIASITGVDRKSQLFRALISGNEEQLKKVHGSYVSREDLKKERTILVHHKAKNAGLKLSTPADVLKNIRIDIDQALKTAETMVGEQVKAVKESLTLKPMPNCKKDKREVFFRGKGPKSTKRTKDFDVLYINKKDLSFTTDLSLGDDVQIKVYDPEKPSLYAYSLKGMGITCLPYRMRLTNTQVFKLQGAPALEDFSSKQRKKKSGKKLKKKRK